MIENTQTLNVYVCINLIKQTFVVVPVQLKSCFPFLSIKALNHNNQLLQLHFPLKGSPKIISIVLFIYKMTHTMITNMH